MTQGMDWQGGVGRSWAENWQLTDRSFAGLTQQLIDRIARRGGEAVLDIGCGAGELSLAVSRRLPKARVVGVDISADLIAAARERGRNANAEFVEGDAAALQMPGFAPDLLVSRHGVMFFADPVAAFADLHANAAPEANLVFSCFRSRGKNYWASGIAGLLNLPDPADPTAPGPFAFADPEHVGKLLSAAGWQRINFEPVDFAYVVGMGDDPIADALGFFKRIGPAATALREMDGPVREAALQSITSWLGEHRSGDLIAFGAAAWIVTASRD